MLASMAFAPTAPSAPCCSSLRSAKTLHPLRAPGCTLTGTRISLRRSAPHREQAHTTTRAVAATKATITEKKSGAKSAEMSTEVAADLYRDMMLGRDFEDMCAQMYYRGKMFGK